jgi:serine phosphatase RsbU (regulator of sigma subunit)
LCTSLVKESFNVIDPLYPAETLDFVRQRIIKFFRSNQVRRTQDGMDIAFCVLDKQANRLYFAGANGSVVIIRDNELIEYSGDKQHVGYNIKQRPFNTQEIDVKSGDCIYLFTDGYSDQFGGEFDKRFTKKRLKKLLLSIYEEPMEEQLSILKHTFYEWKGDTEHTDDVAVVGVKI